MNKIIVMRNLVLTMEFLLVSFHPISLSARHVLLSRPIGLVKVTVL